MRDHDIEEAKQHTLAMEAKPAPKLRDVLAFIEKRRDKISKKSGECMLFMAYTVVVNDLIDNTDSCTGELY